MCVSEIKCGAIGDIGNATLTNQSDPTDYGGWVRYQCLDGFKFPDMDRNKTFTCTASGWQPTVPEACERESEMMQRDEHMQGSTNWVAVLTMT